MVADQRDSFIFFQFGFQLLFQMATGCLFDRAPVGGNRFLLRMALSACSWLDRVRDVPDLWPLRTDFLFFGFGVRIH